MKETLTLLLLLFNFFAISQAEMNDSITGQQDAEYYDQEEQYQEDTTAYVEPSPPMPKLEQKKLNAKRWNELTKGLHYEGFDKPSKELEESKLPNFGFLAALGPLLKYFFIVLILGLLIFLVARWVVNFKRKPDNLLEQVALELDAKGMQLPLNELDQLIASSVEDQAYALAVKLYYLKCLSLLNLKNHITWERHKTNDSYLRECKQKSFLQAFRKITRLYENYWYGKEELSAATFNEIKDLYIDFYQKIH